MTESVGQSWKADRALYVATAVLFLVVLVSGVVARVGRARGHGWYEQSGWHEQYFVLSLCAFLWVAAIAVYGIRRRRGGRAQRRAADPLRSLEIGLAVGLALSTVVLASILASYGWRDSDQRPRRLALQHHVEQAASAPGIFAAYALTKLGVFYVGFQYLYSSALEQYLPDKRLQLWIEIACLNTLGWFMLLSRRNDPRGTNGRPSRVPNSRFLDLFPRPFISPGGGAVGDHQRSTPGSEESSAGSLV